MLFRSLLHQKPTLLFYHIILQYLIYQMFYIFTTSFKYYILILILSFLYNLFHGNISILFQISMVTFQTKLLILFFFFGRNRPACLGFKQYCYFFYFFFLFFRNRPACLGFKQYSSIFFFFLRNRPACLGFKQYS